jgi:inositol oxygenase
MERAEEVKVEEQIAEQPAKGKSTKGKKAAKRKSDGAATKSKKKSSAKKSSKRQKKGKADESKEESAEPAKQETKVASTAIAKEVEAKLLQADAGVIDVDTKGKEIARFRNYQNSARQRTVENFYRLNHQYQTVEHVKSMHQKYLDLNLTKMSMWDCLEYLDTFVDDSDPDTENSQLQHALQTAEAIRAKYPGEEYDWLHLTGLIHDLGKIIGQWGGDKKEPQWTVVGDTFPVGCAFENTCVFHDFFAENPDGKDPRYNTKLGIYKEHCGLNNVQMSWGHDEYLYQVCVGNKSTLPIPALYIIRFHSFYPWHNEGGYRHLMDASDHENLKWVKAFNQFDLYSKAHDRYDVAKLKPYYQKTIKKYFPDVIRW